MKAVVLSPDGLAFREVPDPVPKRGEALIRIRKAGICSTDVELARGYMGFTGVPGHEFVGEVLESGDPAGRGRRVVGEINLPCGECPFCSRGEGNHCPRRTVLGIAGKSGAFAPLVTLPGSNLHFVPQGLSDSEAVFVEPLAAALEICEQTIISAADRVLVLGDGKLGLLIARMMRLKTGHVLCAGRHDRKLALLRKGGIETCLGEVPEDGFEIVVEATGGEEGLALALKAVRPRGRIILKSTYHGRPKLDISRVVVDEILLIGSRCGPFRQALDLLASKSISVLDMIDGDFPLDQAAAAFAEAQKPGVLKILLSP